MSYRDRYRVSGYRSQPVSNRSSLYLPSDYNVTNFSDDLSDFDRQFKKLLERTEKFTNRVEKLQNTATYIKKGFLRIDNTVTGLRSQRDVIETAFDSIENRLYNDVGEPPTTEEEWKRFLDAGILIEKAVELLRNRYKHPKPVFEYSPEDRSPYSYDVSPSTVLVPNPHSPTDAEGNRIRDIGSELRPLTIPSLANNMKNGISKRGHNKIEKPLSPLSEEIIEPTETELVVRRWEKKEKNDDKSNEKNANEFRSSSLFKDETKVSNFKFENADTAIKDVIPGNARRPSFLKTLRNAANKKKTRPLTMYETSSAEFTENEINKEMNRRRREKEKIETESEFYERTNSMQSNLDDVAKSITSSFQSSASSSLSTSLNLCRDDDSPISTFKKRSSSSSFHEYNPGNRIPLKERLRRKQEAEEKANENKSAETKVTRISSSPQKTSKLVKNKSKDENKDENNSSFTSRFLRRFRSSKNNISYESEETTTRRRRTRKRSEEEENPPSVSESELTTMLQRRRKSESEDIKRKNSETSEEKKSSDKLINKEKESFLHNSSDLLNVQKEDVESHCPKESRSIANDFNDEFLNSTPTKTPPDITCSVRPITSTPNNIFGKDENNNKNDKVNLARRQGEVRHASNDKNETITKAIDLLNVEKLNVVKNKVSTDVTETARTDVVRRRRVQEDPTDDVMLKNLNRESVLIFEENIVPKVKTREEKILLFQTPKVSIEEVCEEEIQVADISKEGYFSVDVFEILKTSQHPVSEEEVPLVTLPTKCTVDEEALERVYQITPPEKTGRFFADVHIPRKQNDEERQKLHRSSSNSCEESLTGKMHQEIIDTKTAVEEKDIVNSPLEKNSFAYKSENEFDWINGEHYLESTDLTGENTVTEDNKSKVKEQTMKIIFTREDVTESRSVTKQRNDIGIDGDSSYNLQWNEEGCESDSKYITQNSMISKISADKNSTKLEEALHNLNIDELSTNDLNGGDLKLADVSIRKELVGQTGEGLDSAVCKTRIGNMSFTCDSIERIADSNLNVTEQVKTRSETTEYSDMVSTLDCHNFVLGDNENFTEINLKSEDMATTTGVQAGSETSLWYTEQRPFTEKMVQHNRNNCSEIKTDNKPGGENNQILNNEDLEARPLTPQLSEVGRSSLMGSSKKRLSYREQRGAHMKLLLGSTDLNGSVTSLLEKIDNDVTDEQIDDIPSLNTTPQRIQAGNTMPYRDCTGSMSSFIPATNSDTTEIKCTNNENNKPSSPDIDSDVKQASLFDVEKAPLSDIKQASLSDTMEASLLDERQCTGQAIAPQKNNELVSSLVKDKTTTRQAISAPISPTNDTVFTSLGNRGSEITGNKKSVVKPRSASEPSVRPLLEKQMSIKEYRRRKLESQETSSSCSDESIFEKSDVDKSTMSSLADESDVSNGNQYRNKRYSHSKKDLRDTERTSSSSESDAYPPNDVKNENKMFHRHYAYNGMQSDTSEYRYGENKRKHHDEAVSRTDHRKNYSQLSHRSLDS
ncbi:uncharacterized protein LOC130629052 [Hydractinia symbiolongicarpus]|uniref:uncharacterized protein LOC130629052 n=1 Tax=Hydractinia symbiolongicarpus TaxID=13093 RepID=UPI002551B899|nr:uncharacterized protein LOC130629052 [Hydractinia symbiolongicarpus]